MAKKIGDQFLQKPGTDPATGSPFKSVKLGETQFGTLQEASDVGGLLPVASPLAPRPEVTPGPVIGIDETANNISQGSDRIRDRNTLIDNEAKQLSADAEDGIDTAGVDIGSEFEKLQQQVANIGTLTEQELTSIEEAGTGAGAEFDPLIAGAEERKKFGQAANIVAAGRRGGFQRTRFAGQAALGPTQGDVGFAGAGGKLEATESAFQRNIDALKSRKISAIALAKAQARQAIKTGKREDANTAKEMLDFARKLDADAKKAEQDMFDNLFKLRQEDRQQTTADFNIIKELSEGETINIRGTEFTGIKKTEIDPFFKGSDIIQLMKTLPHGEVTTIQDPNTGVEFEIMGLSTDDPNIKAIQSTNDKGEVTITRYNLDTGAVLSQANAGAVGKTKTRAASTTIVLNEQQAGIIGDSAAKLNAHVGADGFFDTDVFIEERERVAATPGGDVGKFDELFAPRLRPTDPKAKPFIEPSLRPKEEKKSAKDLIAEKLANIEIETTEE